MSQTITPILPINQLPPAPAGAPAPPQGSWVKTGSGFYKEVVLGYNDGTVPGHTVLPMAADHDNPFVGRNIAFDPEKYEPGPQYYIDAASGQPINDPNSPENRRRRAEEKAKAEQVQAEREAARLAAEAEQQKIAEASAASQASRRYGEASIEQAMNIDIQSIQPEPPVSQIPIAQPVQPVGPVRLSAGKPAAKPQVPAGAPQPLVQVRFVTPAMSHTARYHDVLINNGFMALVFDTRFQGAFPTELEPTGENEVFGIQVNDESLLFGCAYHGQRFVIQGLDITILTIVSQTPVEG
jgi:hypothetical protein